MTQWQNGAPISDEVLVAWLDKQLTVQQHQQVEKMLSDDPELAERLFSTHRLRECPTVLKNWPLHFYEPTSP